MSNIIVSTLEEAHEVCAGLNFSEVGSSLATDEEGLIAAQIIQLFEADRISLDVLIDEWLVGRKPIGVTTVGLLVIYQIIVFKTQAISESLRRRELLRMRLESLLFSPHARIRQITAAIFILFFTLKMLDNPEGIAVSMQSRIESEGNSSVRDEMGEFINLISLCKSQVFRNRV